MFPINPVAKILILTGSALIIAGVMWQFGLIDYLKLGRLPGDIVIEREHTKIYIPIATCLILSALLSLISYIFRS
jgi:hypothetical protein